MNYYRFPIIPNHSTPVDCSDMVLYKTKTVLGKNLKENALLLIFDKANIGANSKNVESTFFPFL